jgi:lipopolysaccharide biosynthesis glycosyltransferase
VILNHLSAHEAMVWLDADTLILSQNQRVFEKVLKSSKNLHLSRDFAKGSAAFNGGVILFKNDPWVFQLLKDWDAFALVNKPAKLWDHGSDQKVLSDFILERDPNGEFHEAHDMAEFNTDPRFMDENTFLLHFMAYPTGYKIPWMHFWNTNNLDFNEADFIERIQPL